MGDKCKVMRSKALECIGREVGDKPEIRNLHCLYVDKDVQTHNTLAAQRHTKTYGKNQVVASRLSKANAL